MCVQYVQHHLTNNQMNKSITWIICSKSNKKNVCAHKHLLARIDERVAQRMWATTEKTWERQQGTKKKTTIVVVVGIQYAYKMQIIHMSGDIFVVKLCKQKMEFLDKRMRTIMCPQDQFDPKRILIKPNVRFSVFFGDWSHFSQLNSTFSGIGKPNNALMWQTYKWIRWIVCHVMENAYV